MTDQAQDVPAEEVHQYLDATDQDGSPVRVDRPEAITDQQWADLVSAFQVGRGLAIRNLAEWALKLHGEVTESAKKLEGERQQAQTLMDSRQRQISTLQRRLDYVAEALLAEAEERDWCSEYDEFVNKVNNHLGYTVLTPRSREYEVTYTVTFTVEARDEDEAQETADEYMSAAERQAEVFVSWGHDRTSEA